MSIKLYNDDCFNILNTLEDKSVNLFILDLPYGQTANKWDSVIDLEQMWIEIKRILTDNGMVIFFCTTKFGYTIINSNPKWFKYDLIWEKCSAQGFLNCNNAPLRKHEMIYVFSNPKNKVKEKTYNPQKTKGKPYKLIKKDNRCINYGNIKAKNIDNKGTRFPVSIIKFGFDKDKYHPTQKPLKLLEWVIKTYSNVNDMVCDFTMGSGGCGVVCKDLKRSFVGIEKNKEYFDIAKKRME